LRLPPIKDELISLTDAAEILSIDKGNVSRLANSDAIKDNGIKGSKRQVWKSSVLFYKHQREDEQLLKDAKELRRDSGEISNSH